MRKGVRGPASHLPRAAGQGEGHLLNDQEPLQLGAQRGAAFWPQPCRPFCKAEQGSGYWGETGAALESFGDETGRTCSHARDTRTIPPRRRRWPRTVISRGRGPSPAVRPAAACPAGDRRARAPGDGPGRATRTDPGEAAVAGPRHPPASTGAEPPDPRGLPEVEP